MTRARLTVDLGALAANYRTLRAAAAGAETAPVLKADGYGLGAAEAGRRLASEGARSFFVARLEEGEALRGALGPAARIYVLDGLAGAAPPRFAAAALTPVLSTPADVAAWRPTGVAAALHIDTGMNRLGLSQTEAAAATALSVVHVMSHLACAAEPNNPRNRRQLEAFRAARAAFPQASASLAASAGVFLGPDFAFDMVRPGVSLFGGGPRERPDPRIRAVARLEAPVLRLRDVSAGEKVGYSDGFTAPRPMRIAILGAGYADGVMRRSMGRASGMMRGARVPILVVSMDLIAVDVSDCPGAAQGDLVELLGPDALVDDLAAAAGTVAHECLVRLGGRAERRYLGALTTSARSPNG